jgi:hypothetical protein
MHEPDAISLAVFDDEPKLCPSPGASGSPPAAPALGIGTRPALAFDVCLLDPETGSFFVLYAAGTPLAHLKPRTVSFPTGNGGPPATSLTLYARASADPQPVPYLTLPCPQGVAGPLTVRFRDPADPQSLVIESDPCRRS